MKKNQEIKEIIEIFLKKLTVDFENIDIFDDSNGNLKFAIKSNDSGILIGSEGKNIKALNYLIKKIVRKDNYDSKINFFIDVNDYQEKNIEVIKKKALDIAEKSLVFKRNIEMEPMTSFERMLVHSVLSDKKGVETESTGERKFRRVVIKFKETNF